MKIARRSVLVGAGSAVIARNPALAAIGRGVAVPGIGGGGGGLPALTAEITFPGGVPTASTLVYDIATGTDIGSYVPPTAGFTQRCIRVRNVALANFFVDFRPDVSGGRVEAVFWNGETDPAGLTVASGHVRDLRPYNVNVKNAGVSVYTALIPQHYWATRWRYQSAVRSVIRTASQVFSDGYLPHMSLTAARLSGNNSSTGQAWSGLPYSDVSGQIIQPSLARGHAQVITTAYTPFMALDTSPGGSAAPTTTLGSGASAGATSLTLASVPAGWTNGGNNPHIAIQLADGTYFSTRLIGADPQTTTATIELGLPSAAGSGATVYLSDYKLGLITYMETGGERAELGLITEWAGDYLLNGTANSLNAIRQHAEMASSEWPFFLSDLASSAALNFQSDVTHYKVIADAVDYGGYYRAAYTNETNGWDFHEQDSHFQMHGYIAYALTEDAYFLECCQYLQAYGMGNRGTMLGREGNPTSTHGQFGWGDLLGTANGTGGVNGSFTMCSYYGEIRTVGNGIRNLAMTYKVSPTSPPSWLLPKSYYASISSDYSKVIDTLWTGSTDTLHSVFRQLSSDPYYQIFEQSYGIMGMALADLVGMPVGSSPSWLSTLTFYFGMHDAITNGTSGWNRQCPQPHDLRNDGSENPFVNVSSKTTWTALWSAVSGFFQTGTFPSAASPGNQQGGSMGNCNDVYAACACAKSRGVTAATNAKAWMDTFIDYNYPNNSDASMGISMEMKFAFDGT